MPGKMCNWDTVGYSRPTRWWYGRKCQKIMRELISSNVTLFTNTGIEMVCNACSAPNNLLTAAKRARLELLVSRQRRLAMITAVTVTVLAVCMSPVGLAYSVSCWSNFKCLGNLHLGISFLPAAKPPVYNSRFYQRQRDFYKWAFLAASKTPLLISRFHYLSSSSS